MRTGIILAGGRSTRFEEGDKALADVAGEPMIGRVARKVAVVADELVVNCRATQVRGIRRALPDATPTPRFAIDDVPDRGPVRGVAKSFRIAEGSKAAVTACDMPTLDPEFLGSLFRDARDERGAVPVFEGHPQPLCAVYDVGAASTACHAARADGQNAMRAVVDRLDPHFVPEAEVRDRTDPATFRNVNTREHLQAVEADLKSTSEPTEEGTGSSEGVHAIEGRRRR